MVTANKATQEFPFVLTLAKPLVAGGQTHSTITLREPLPRDWRRWGSKPEGVERILGLLGDLSGLDETAFDALGFRDFAVLVQVAENFFDAFVSEEERMTRQLLNSRSVLDGLRPTVKG